jgi:hypothetical protein
VRARGIWKMKKKILTIFVISLFTLTVFFAAGLVQAAEGDWITNYTVRDLATGEIILQRTQTGTSSADNLLEGQEVNVTITIDVPITVPDSTLSLSTSMQHSSSQDRYWELKTTSYTVQGYNPNTQTVTFSQTEGTLTISCYGLIPTGLTTTSSGSGTQLHKPYPFALVKLTGPSGETLDKVEPMVIDAKIAEFNNLLDGSKDNLQTLVDQGTAQAYVSLYTNVITGSEAAAEEGFVDNAISQLHQLAITEAPPVAATASMADTLFLPLVGALAAIAVIIMVLFFRARGKASYVSQVVEDQIRDLEGLTLRASKVDKSLSSGLETVEERLKRAVGA